MKKGIIVLMVIFTLVSTSIFAKTHLVWSVHWTDYQVDGIKDANGNITTKGVQQYVDEYMKLHPDVEIKVQPVAYDDYLKTILISHTAGNVSDIYGLYSLWAVQLAQSGILDNVPSDLQKLINDNCIKAAIDGSTINNKLMGVPMEVDNYALIYNKEMLKEAGFNNPPKTWDELVAMAPKMTVRAADGTVKKYGFAFLSGWDSAVVHPYLSILYSLGGTMFNDDFSKCTLTSPEAIEALNKELILFKNGATDPAASVYDFANDKVAMIIMAPWYENTLKIAFKDKYVEKVGVAPFPYVKKPCSAGYTWFLSVDKASKNKKQAWDFIKWFAFDKLPNGSSRLGELMAMNIGSIPPMKSDIAAFPEELNDLYTSVFVKQLDSTVAEPNVVQGEEIKTVLMRQIVEAWHGNKTSEQALTEAKKEIDEILEEYY